MNKFLLGTKEQMTQYFTEEGKAIPVTVVNVGPMTVTQVKTTDTDGYEAVQYGTGVRREKNINKPQLSAWKDLGTFCSVREFRLDAPSELKKGDVLNPADVLQVGQAITVTGVSKGKGFQGVVKRHNFAGGRRSHGQKHSEREPGSIGSTGPQRVFKGTRMGGRMGSDRVSVKNLEVVAMDTEKNVVFVKGAVPGRRGTLLEIVTQ